MDLTRFFKPESPPKPITWVAKANRPENVGFESSDPDLLSGRFVRVDEVNYPRLFNISKEVAEHFGVRHPAVYVDTKQRLGLAYAYFDTESIVVASGVEGLFNDEELKALFAHETKHFYQPRAKTREGIWRNEHDADMAAVEAVGMKTIRSYVDKAAEMKIEKMIPFKPLKELVIKIHRAIPGALACATIFPIDMEHPPVSKRLSEMKKYEQAHGSTETKNR